MKFYEDSSNCIWLPDDSAFPSDFQSYQKERQILRILVKECIGKYDPFIVISAFCASDYAHMICQNNHNGYFYGEGTFLNDLHRMGLLVSRGLDWDIVIFHWIIDVYLTARYELGMSYKDIACIYPVQCVYNVFNPLHETSEFNALHKMSFDKKSLSGCVINETYYLFSDDIPEDKRYLLDKASEARACNTCFWNNALFFDDSIVCDLGAASWDYCTEGNCSYHDLVSVLRDLIFNDAGLKKKILNTTGMFVYCSMDTMLGIGLNISDHVKVNQYQWRGQNLLGLALQEVYSALKEN